MEKLLNVRLLLIAIVFLSSISVYSQRNDSIQEINRKYKNEIGIDFKGFTGGSIGTAIIYKKKYNTGRLVSMSFARNLRYQVGLDVNFPLGKSVSTVDSLKIIESNQTKYFSIQPRFGIEKIYYNDKFGFYYGIDFGVGYSYNASAYDVYMLKFNTGNGQSADLYSLNTLPYKSTMINAGLYPFFGVKYRFAERFSVSIETSISLVYEYSHVSTISRYYNVEGVPQYYYNYYYGYLNSYTKPEFNNVDRTHLIRLNINYLRFLTLNYHF